MSMFPLIAAATDATEAAVKKGGFSLDALLSFLVPLAIFIMFGFMIYKNFPKEIDSLMAWIKKQFAEKPQQQQVPVNNPYMQDGTIVYR